MKRRARTRHGLAFGLLIGFGAGFAALTIAIVALFGVIVDERREALFELDRGEIEIERAATARLREALARSLDGVEEHVASALAHPLSPSAELLFVEDGTQILPRRRAQAASSEAVALLQSLAESRDFRPEIKGLQERIALVHELPTSYAAWIEHRRRNVLRADLELASTLYALERLDHARALTPEQAQALLRDGISDRDGRIEGWFASLIAARARLSRDDFGHLVGRATDLARRLLVRVDDVLEHVRDGAELPRALLDGDGGSPIGDGHAGVFADGWVANVRGRQTVGRRVSVPAIIAEVQRDLGPQVALELAPGTGSPAIDARSRLWDEARATRQERFVLKALALGAIGVLAVTVGALALLLQRRRAAYVDLRTQLLAAVTHELKTPLASIRAMAETLELRLAGHPDARDYPTRIVASAERLAFLVDNVLGFKRLEHGTWKPRPTVIPLADLVTWLASDPIARAVRPVDLTTRVPSGLTLVADPDLVRLMLSNLLDNAARYALADRVAVTLGACSDAHGVHLELSDDGPGLAHRDQARVLDALEAGQGLGGTGLGLAICRMVMALHGGTLTVSSSPSGSAFVATFPARAHAVHPVFEPAPNA